MRTLTITLLSLGEIVAVESDPDRQSRFLTQTIHARYLLGIIRPLGPFQILLIDQMLDCLFDLLDIGREHF